MLFVALLAASALSSPLLVRKGEASLMPPEPLQLGGYTARAEKPFEPGGDELKCRVVVLEQGRLKVAMVSVEMLTVPDSLYREVKKRLPPDLHLLLTATHTHCAPDSQMLNSQMTLKVPGIAIFKPKWLEWYADGIAETVRATSAGASTRIGELLWASTQVPLNRARRVGGHPDPEETLVSYDKTSQWAISISQRPRAAESGTEPLWFHFAAHPVFFDKDEMHTRGDWPGKIANRLHAPVLQGAIGDISPWSPGATPEERIGNFEKAALTAMYYGPSVRVQNCDVVPFDWTEVPIKLDPVAPHPDFAKDNHVPEALAKLFVNTVAPKTGSVYAFRIGKLAVVGVCGEPSGALGWRIRNYGLSIGFSAVQVVSHVNGWIGYILEPDDYDRGGYEATLGFHGRMTGERVVDAAKEALRELAHPTASAQKSGLSSRTK